MCCCSVCVFLDGEGCCGNRCAGAFVVRKVRCCGQKRMWEWAAWMAMRGEIRKMRVGLHFRLKVKRMVLHGKSIRFAVQKVTFRTTKGNLLLYKTNVFVMRCFVGGYKKRWDEASIRLRPTFSYICFALPGGQFRSACFPMPPFLVCALRLQFLRQHLGAAFPVDGRRDDAACVSGTFAAGIEAAKGDVLQCLVVAQDTYWR